MLKSQLTAFGAKTNSLKTLLSVYTNVYHMGYIIGHNLALTEIKER